MVLILLGEFGFGVHSPRPEGSLIKKGPGPKLPTHHVIVQTRAPRDHPPTNHGEGDNGFIPALVGVARDKGISGHVGDGATRWPAVHRLDSAHLFRLALERAPAGSTLHAVADEGVPIREIAEVIGRHLGLPVASVPPEEAGAHFTWLAAFLAADIPASSALTRELLGWEPTRPGLIADLDKGHYFHTE